MKNLISLYRKKNNFTQSEFARMLGISPSYLCKIEKSLQAPSDKIIQRCTKLLGVSKGELFPDDTKKSFTQFTKPSHLSQIWFERTNRGLKQNDLAKYLKCSPSYLCKVENKQIVPTEYFIKQCITFFKKTKSELFPSLENND